MILFLVSFYAYRKNFFLAYGLLIIFVAYYIQFALTLKMIYGIAMNINSIKELLKDNKESIWVVYSEIIFGVKQTDDGGEIEVMVRKGLFYFTLVACIMLAQAWKQAKWLDINEKIGENVDTVFGNWFLKLIHYLENRDSFVSNFEFLRGVTKEKAKEAKQMKKSKKLMGKMQASKYFKTSNDSISSFKKDLNNYLPIIIMWTLRFALIFQSYLYHSNSGMLHLFFVLMSFVLPLNIVLFISFTFMLPIYSAEFILMYGMRIPVVNKTEFFMTHGQAFDFEMKLPILEQLLYFLILALFCMTISCFKLSYEINQNE
jgi:hypothetical protein